MSFTPHESSVEFADPPLASAIWTLSRGNVTAIPASGPVFAPSRRPRYRARRRTFTPLLAAEDRIAVRLFTAAWLAASAWFWIWWLQPAHRASMGGFVVSSALLAYLTGNAVYFLVACNRLRGIGPSAPLPDVRVAFAVTKAPSEPWDTARATLEAMLGQDLPGPYDVWLCDEDPSFETLAWCEWAGVRVSTRRGVGSYHRQTWPRRTRCKEGNLAYFYDHWGYRDYDVVAQLDCDHVPAPGYLRAMVRPFSDPGIGYVAAPSVCDSNADRSWSARGRTHREATFDGPSQAGHNGGLAPVCIGSHYAVRTEALREAGGLGPELAEDFSTTFVFQCAGWDGAFAIGATAHGEGPVTFAAMITQEFQWARSLTTLFLGLVPRSLPRLPWRLRLRFLYALAYYPLLSLSMIGGVLLAPVAAVTGLTWARVGYGEFMLRWCAAAACILALTLFLRRRGLLRPADAPIVSWELWLYVLTRWPYIAYGVAAALVQKVRPRPVTFRVTPKGDAGLEPLGVRVMAPYLLVSLLFSGSALAGERLAHGPGYVLLCLLGAVNYAVVSVAVPILHAREAARGSVVSAPAALAATAGAPFLCGLLTLLPVAAALTRYPASGFAASLW
ncbi:MAG: hypothetical protein JWO79_402 [Actinomycetia bacterium]|nr:hypothetical protein [Actinomycetes bacterium]